MIVLEGGKAIRVDGEELFVLVNQMLILMWVFFVTIFCLKVFT